MTIRWGVSPIAWANDDMPELGSETTLDELLSDVREIGFEGLELGNKLPRDPDELELLMQSYGLVIVGGWYGSRLLTQEADAEIEAMQPHLRLLERMGSSIFILAETSNAVHADRRSCLDRHPRLGTSDWEIFGRRLNRVAEYLEHRGCRLAYHHHLGTAVETAVELAVVLRGDRRSSRYCPRHGPCRVRRHRPGGNCPGVSLAHHPCSLQGR